MSHPLANKVRPHDYVHPSDKDAERYFEKLKDDRYYYRKFARIGAAAAAIFFGLGLSNADMPDDRIEVAVELNFCVTIGGLGLMSALFYKDSLETEEDMSQYLGEGMEHYRYAGAEMPTWMASEISLRQGQKSE